jgi:hypothetical protein
MNLILFFLSNTLYKRYVNQRVVYSENIREIKRLFNFTRPLFYILSSNIKKKTMSNSKSYSQNSGTNEEKTSVEISEIIENCIFKDEITIDCKKLDSRLGEYDSLHVCITQKTFKKETVGVTVEIHKFDDIFFLLKCEIDNVRYGEICQEYDLTISFNDFVQSIVSMLINTINDNKSTRVNFQYTSNGGKMTFYGVLDVKEVIIFAIEFQEVSKEEKIQEAQKKFNKAKEELDTKNRQLDVFVDQVKKLNYTMMDYLVPKYNRKAGAAKSATSPKTPVSPN